MYSGPFALAKEPGSIPGFSLYEGFSVVLEGGEMHSPELKAYRFSKQQQAERFRRRCLLLLL